MRWRWDQGRLEYLKFENLVTIAKVLQSLDGLLLNTTTDFLRSPLESKTGLPFSPAHYKVWRNYARVFHCAMLATCIDGKLVITDLCRKLIESSAEFSSDEYFNFIFSHFILPFPAFDGYDSQVQQTFPFVAIAKFAISYQTAGITLQDVFKYVIGNDCTGLETLNHYASLKQTSRTPQGDEERQVREMLVFMGQVSYLKWLDKRLFIDSVDIDTILKAIAPFVNNSRKENAQEEFIRLTTFSKGVSAATFDIVLKDREVEGFSVKEGGKVFTSHGKIERSPLVRKRFFEAHPEIVCDACQVRTRERYPWTDNILELHHVLPLAATLNVNGTTTVLDDLMPLCPSCHKSIHIFYKIKLAEWGVPDFGSKKMAKDVYAMAKGEIQA